MQAALRRRLAALAVVLLVPLAARSEEGAPFAEHTFDSSGVPIRYIVAGVGDPVVLIHGFSASAETNWLLPGVFQRLAEDFQVIAIDNRGHGKSGKPHEVDAYGTEMAQDVVRLLDHLKIRQAHIVGYSMGGFITMKLLTLAPEHFLSAVVGGAGWLRPDPSGAAMREELAKSLESGAGIGPLLRALNPTEGPPMSDEQIATLNNLVVAANDSLALAAAIRGMERLQVTAEELGVNEVPTLAVIGSRDPLKAGVDAMIGVMANLEVEVIDGADHLSAVQSSELAEAIRAFFVRLCQCA
jgi:pimeloyl-ACP methyl ester carboxylesterase